MKNRLTKREKMSKSYYSDLVYRITHVLHFGNENLWFLTYETIYGTVVYQHAILCVSTLCTDTLLDNAKIKVNARFDKDCWPCKFTDL